MKKILTAAMENLKIPLSTFDMMKNKMAKGLSQFVFRINNENRVSYFLFVE